jgi:IS5 family transposase
MREKRTIQASIFEYYPAHEIGRELKAMSERLDANPDLLDWIAADVKNHHVEETGRQGLTIDSVLRCALLKQYRQLSYEDLVILPDGLFCLPDICPLKRGMDTEKAHVAEQYQRYLCGHMGTDQLTVVAKCSAREARKRQDVANRQYCHRIDDS